MILTPVQYTKHTLDNETEIRVSFAMFVEKAKVSDKNLFGIKQLLLLGAQWLSGKVLDSRLKGCGFKPHRHHCVVVLEQDTFILA